MKQKLTLFWNLGSQPARAVEALLRIGKIQHQLISKDVAKQQTRSKQYLEMNPLGQIPFLVDGKTKIGQSNAIMVYLCELHDSIPKHYYGSTAQQRAKTNQYISWYQYYFRPALFKIIKIKVYGFIRKKKAYQSYQIKSAIKQMYEAIKTLQMLLTKNGTKFISGNEPCIADLLIYFQLTNVQYYGQSISQYKEVNDWYLRMGQIPEVKSINNEWIPISKQFKKFLDSIKAEDQKNPKSSL